MKRHLLGFCVALFFAFTSFYVSPIRFSITALGLGTTEDYVGDCRFYPHISNHFTRLFWNLCVFENSEQTKNYSRKISEKSSKTIEPETEIKLENRKSLKRKIISLERHDEKLLCIIREYEYSVNEICSTSLRHILEFEQQKSW